MNAKIQLVKQDEIERRMLAADLHDQVLNDLRLIQQKFNQYTVLLKDNCTAEINQLLGQAINQTREVMESLYPSTIQHLGLSATIEDCLRQGSGKAGLKSKFCNLLKNGELEKLSLVEQSLLYRLTQEAITNICKHAQAKNVEVTIKNGDSALVINIVDDGCGITRTSLQQDSRGLRYMRQRADLIGASISWQTGTNGKGTIVEIRK